MRSNSFIIIYNWKRWKEWQVAKYWASASPWFAAFSMYSMPLGTSISTPRIFTLSSCSSYIWKRFILCQFKSATITQPHRSHSLAGSFNLKQLRGPKPRRSARPNLKCESREELIVTAVNGCLCDVTLTMARRPSVWPQTMLPPGLFFLNHP